MKKYSFRLQPVLDIREKVLEEKRLEMAKVIKLLNEYQDKLVALEEKQFSYRKELENLSVQDANINTSQISEYQAYIVYLNQEILKQKELINNTQKALREKQAAVNEALKEVKVLEKLKETQSEKFYKEIYKKEAEDIDDIVSARYKFQLA